VVHGLAPRHARRPLATFSRSSRSKARGSRSHVLASATAKSIGTA
jgi:hypothetical protein